MKAIMGPQFSLWEKMNGTNKGSSTMKNAFYALWYCERDLLGWSNIEKWKIKPVALDVVELYELEGIRQAVSQSLENSFF